MPSYLIYIVEFFHHNERNYKAIYIETDLSLPNPPPKTTSNTSLDHSRRDLLPVTPDDKRLYPETPLGRREDWLADVERLAVEKGIFTR
ncbi:hypothetical protein N7462_005045 [Penicillium macrosclerotiorum]|uniref:uncharacterized protein n=1 Tax=Penicillium macrosclerotiorum TaxID=303699 RepID=UPI002549B423|nr:uncharacterized protein N7462_005045 [Penicillium macrosclerotiorum]KAJ5690653.1 hypothetical protein N7462_005045 [Penicillium macrosclerotiorum]